MKTILAVSTIAAGMSAFAVPALADQQRSNRPVFARPEVQTAASQRRICKTETETGSLARQRRRCYTVEEWNRLADGIQATARDLVDGGRTRPSGGF